MNDAKLIAVTRPMSGLDPEAFIAYVARVSNSSNQNNNETSTKLLKYLIKHKHWSPFELISVVMEINTTRDIARQILRHRSFTFQEFSQRYADPTKDLGFTIREARLQDTKNRQNSIEISAAESESRANFINDWTVMQESIIEQVQEAYQWAIENGIAKEQARAILPEGLTNSRMYMSGSLRSWIHYCDLRRANGTQKEHQEVAESAWYELMKEFPFLGEYNV